MRPEDTQMDVLMRRHAKHAERASLTEHPDPDELSAFAEGALPAAARSHYVSHLADCDDCRNLVSRLTVAAGRTAESFATTSPATEQVSWWQKFGMAFARQTLRYAALAMVAIVVLGIGVLVLRRPQPATQELITTNQPTPGDESNRAAASAPVTGTIATQNAQAPAPAIAKNSSATPLPAGKLDGADIESGTAAPPKPEKAPAMAKSEVAADRPAESARAEMSPAYAPPPPNEADRSVVRARESQTVGGLAGGPRRNETERFKDLSRSGGPAKDSVGEARTMKDERSVSSTDRDDASSRGRKEANKAAPPPRSTNEAGTEARQQSEEAKQTKAEQKTETRKAGGRKFERRGNVWVDMKYKSSMGLKAVSRSSQEFEALDSGLRSIAQQIGGELIVVWKGKAYLFR